MFDLTAMTPVGARLTGIRVDSLDQGAAAKIRQLLAEHGVLVLPGQHIGDDRFLRFLRSFGPTMFTVGETPVPGYPELNVVSNVGRTRSAAINVSYRHKLCAKASGIHRLTGGLGAQARRPDAVQQSICRVRDVAQPRSPRAERTGDHPRGHRPGSGADHEKSAVHPLFRIHPISGRTFLYLSAPSRCAHISGMSQRRAGEVIAYLFHHSTRDENVYRHAWAPGDVVMWDNRCVLHRADHVGRRRRSRVAPRHGRRRHPGMNRIRSRLSASDLTLEE